MAVSGILLVDKPEGWTSHDVVAKLRGVYGERRVGHSGTLDPMATGLLVVFFGRATRAVEFAENHETRYLAGLRLGLETDTQDTTGRTLRETPVSVGREELVSALSRFRGEILQVPPMYSAVKRNGQKRYEIARKGGVVERAPRSVTIRELELLEGQGRDWLLSVTCSKGTYIRTLCHDIGQALGCGGAMCSLRRVNCGRFGIARAHTLDEILLRKGQGRERELLLPVDSLFSEYPEAVIDPEEEKKCRCGTDFSTMLPEGRYRVYSENGEFLMLGSAENGRMKTVKNFFEV